MFVEKVEPTAELRKKTLETVSECFALDKKENWQKFCGIQYLCNGEESLVSFYSPTSSNSGLSTLFRPIYDCCTTTLKKKAPELSDKQARYLVIPTITYTLCDPCPKNPFIGLAEEFGLDECVSAFPLFFNSEWYEVCETVLDECMHTKEFYELFWKHYTLPLNYICSI